MRLMKCVLATAAAQLCTFGVIATLIGGCAEPDRLVDADGNPPGNDGQNRAPNIADLTIQPESIAAGGTATVTAQASDPDGDRITWSLAMDSNGLFGVERLAGGSFSPREGAGGTVSSTFTPTGSGMTRIILTVFDSRGGIGTAERRVSVATPAPPVASE
jgi:hypothetical protein